MTVKTKYRIYEVSEEGLLERPKEYEHGSAYFRFSDHDTFDDAINALVKENAEQSVGEVVIIPVTLIS